MANRGLGKQQPPLWSLPVSQRPPSSLASLVVTLPLTVGFIVVFDVGILATVLLLVWLYPLCYSWSIRTRRTYRQLGKRAFGRLLVLIVRWFSPTELVLSAGRGIDEQGWIERDTEGKNLVSLKLPEKALWISNHTTLTDWIYLWNLAYLSRNGEHSASLFISLKNSLRRIPLVGAACQLFGFIFMARKWATDKEPLARQLDEIARENAAAGAGEPVALLLFPEGTIVTANTRGIAKKYAEKTHIADFKHLLLPRSTGLFFALRQLARTTPSLHLVDITVGYPLPRSSPSASPLYASDFYTLPSVLLSHVAPPELHMHIRAFSLSEIPLGNLDIADGEGTEDEKRAFERWLYDRWAEKDALLEQFRTRGTFVGVDVDVGKQSEPGKGRSGGGGATGLTRRRGGHAGSDDDNDEDDDDDDDDEERRGEYRWPVSLRHPARELPAAFQFGWPFLVAYLLWAHRQDILASIVSIFVSVCGRFAGEGQVQSSGKTDL